MRYLILLIMATALSHSVLANEATDCFNKTWAHPDDGGLGLTRGQAVRLCAKTTNAVKITKCFEKAWGHPSDGGLGLNRGQAVNLCATTKER